MCPTLSSCANAIPYEPIGYEANHASLVSVHSPPIASVPCGWQFASGRIPRIEPPPSHSNTTRSKSKNRRW